jgi:hypothetical protein
MMSDQRQRAQAAEQRSILEYTVAHFKEVARQNRFAENSAVDHDKARCAVCHPELLALEPFETYLEVVAESVKVRRPRLDQDLVGAINSDLALMGLDARVSLELLHSGETEAVERWSEWIREALATGLGLLSVHSPGSREFSLDDPDSATWQTLVEEKIKGIMEYQRQNP